MCIVFAVLHSEKAFHNAAKRNDTGKMLELIRKGVDIRVKNNVSLLQLRELILCSFDFWIDFEVLLSYLNREK